jgi:hypothetical protein
MPARDRLAHESAYQVLGHEQLAADAGVPLRKIARPDKPIPFRTTAIQYASLNFPPPSGWLQYNGLQMIAYFTTVFVAAPLAIVTGLLMSPAVAARFKTAKGFLNRQMARTVHFMVLAYFIVFILGHVAMVFTTGLIENLNHITRGVNDDSLGGLVLFLVGVALVVAAWLFATPLTLKFPRLVQHGGRLVTRWFGDLLEKEKPVAKFEEKDISPYFWPQGKEPDSEESRSNRDLGAERFAVSRRQAWNQGVARTICS